MRTFRNAELNLCAHQTIMDVYFKFHDGWSNSLRGDDNNKLHRTGG